MATPAKSDTDTRQRLIEEAGVVFAEVGFKAATVREICRRSDANVAAISYHFGDKAGLYRAVLHSAFEAAEERHPREGRVRAGASPEEELHAFVLAFLQRIYGGGVPAWLMKILSREMFEPTDALEHLVQTVHAPTFASLRKIVRRVGGSSLREPELLRCTQSVIAQCVFYKHAAAVLRFMGHAQPAGSKEIERLANQIARFSVAGIRAAAGTKAVGR
jgi:AcrR family transcriptional regulator